jgi:integrase
MSPRKLPAGVRHRVWPSGTVTYEASWFDAAGRRHTENFDTAAEADNARQEHLRNRRRGGSGDPTGGKIPLWVWWARWMRTRQIVDSTRARDESIWACHIEPAFGVMPLAKIRRSDVAAWVVELREDLAPSTVTRCLVVVKKCFSDAVAEGLIAASPALSVKPPRPDHIERRFLTLDELNRIEAAMARRWRIVVPFAACTGLRIGELAALRTADVNLAAREVKVRATAVGVSKRVSNRDTRRQEHLPKTSSSERTVPTITDELAERLARHITDQGLERGDLLFTGRQGGPMTPDNWRRRIWDTAVEKARLVDPQPTPHSLRHTAVALWIGADADRLTVGRWAGHADSSFTERAYGHLWKQDHTDTRAAIAELLSGGNVSPLRNISSGGWRMDNHQTQEARSQAVAEKWA